MINPYVRYIGGINSSVSEPDSELTQYIEKYVFYENTNITNNFYLNTISNGKVELFIHYNESYIFIINNKVEIRLTNFIVGISELSNSLKIKPISENQCFKGLSITFSLQGVCQLFDIHLKTITNRVVRLESILGKDGKTLVKNISEARCNNEREYILNQFFRILLQMKKKRKIKTYRQSIM